MAHIRLYDLSLSGNCFKVRLMLNLLGVDFELVPVDFMNGAHKNGDMLQLNPFGEIPILEHDDLIVRDSQAILVFLARTYGSESWLPTEPEAMARVIEWLMVAENEIARGPGKARLHDLLGYDLDVSAAREHAHRILMILERHLETREWLALGHPTIADVACFPYVALSPEGGVDLSSYRAVSQWVSRLKALPGFVSMPGIKQVVE